MSTVESHSVPPTVQVNREMTKAARSTDRLYHVFGDYCNDRIYCVDLQVCCTQQLKGIMVVEAMPCVLNLPIGRKLY